MKRTYLVTLKDGAEFKVHAEAINFDAIGYHFARRPSITGQDDDTQAPVLIASFPRDSVVSVHLHEDGDVEDLT
jgi:hypothetical protein